MDDLSFRLGDHGRYPARAMNEIKVVNRGRGGYVELEGKRYPIEMFGDGSFSIHFPCGNRHARLQAHLDELKKFSLNQNPQWSIENGSRKYR